MNGFRRKKVQSLTLGEKIKKIRSDKRATFSDISKNTMIQVKYLEYLENGEYDKLPADVYVKGFLRSFAEYLGADERDLIKSFEKEKSIRENIIEKKESGKNKKSKKINLSKFYVTPKIISAILVVLVFVGLFFYLYQKMDKFVAVPELIVLNPENDSVIEQSQVFVKGKTDGGNEVFINNQPVTVDEKGFFSQQVILKNGVNVIVVKSVNRFGKETAKTVSVEARYVQEQNPDNNESENNSENKQSEDENNENQQTDTNDNSIDNVVDNKENNNN